MRTCFSNGPSALLVHKDIALLRRLCAALDGTGLTIVTVDSPGACVSALQCGEFAVLLADLTQPNIPPSQRCSTVAGTGLRPQWPEHDANPSSGQEDVTFEGQGGERGESSLIHGVDLLRAIRRVSPDTRIVALVGPHTGLDVCCQAVTLGACGFVDWSGGDGAALLRERVQQAVERYEAARRERDEVQRGQIFDETGIAGQSRMMADLLLQARRAAMISDVPVLIYGESGTGKQLIAEAIHRLDPKRRDHAFLSVNCAAIQGTLAESALFGHVRGAYTGATEPRQGYFRAAGKGTLLLDEISELDRALQPKLLRALQEGKVLPVGADSEIPVQARVIAVSNRPLAALVEGGEFRLDLYQRLNVISLHVPPLRDRPEDVPLLVQFFVRKYASYYPPGIREIDPRVSEVLTRSIGSGNVRELENTVRQMLVLKTSGHRLELHDVPPDVLERRAASGQESGRIFAALASAVCWMIRDGRWSLQQMLDEFEKLAIREAVSSPSTSHEEIANRLGITRRTLYNKLHRHGLFNERSS